MKLLYITLWDFHLGEADGVVKKIKQHIREFCKNGFDVDYTTLDKENGIVLLNENEILGKCTGIVGISAINIITDYLKENVYPYVYVRHPGRIDWTVLRMLKTVKKNGTKTVYEIPTYPYSGESKSVRAHLDLCVDHIFRYGIKKYVDKIAAFTEKSRIWGIDVLLLKNGVEFDKLLPKEINIYNNSINIICVANVAYWHGYDRMIRGLDNYVSENSNSRKVFFHIVGEGKEVDDYKKYVEKNHLQEYIFFYGKKSGRQLNEIYNKGDLAVDCLGLHRKKVERVSSIKSKEYLAKGLPIIYSGYIDVINEGNSKYFLQIPKGDDPINIKDIIEFFDSLHLDKYDEKLQIAYELHENGKKYYDISRTFEPVIEYFIQNV